VSSVAPPQPKQKIFNVPNQITSARLVLAVVLFVFLGLGFFFTSFVLFLIAASTDWIDGYWARKYGQVTKLGRILDPFADKLIVCGTFIYLAAIPEQFSGIAPWVAVVIFGREILVTALRSFLEEQGGDFSASWPGKIKMVVQCAAICFSLFRLTYANPAALDHNTLLNAGPTDTLQAWLKEPPTWMNWGLFLCVWGAVISTVYSGIGYIFVAMRLMRR
jgi:CDP-diacylglycerol--glycerol-3-phosphate 3-phosphatidyltransferase